MSDFVQRYSTASKTIDEVGKQPSFVLNQVEMALF